MGVGGMIRNITRQAIASVPMLGVTDEAAQITGQAASDLIKAKVQSAVPTLITRFGSNELNILVGYCYPPSLQNYVRYFKSEISNAGWTRAAVNSFVNNAGFFPGTRDCLTRYSEMTLDDMRYIDILGTWLRQEQLFNSQLFHVKKIPLQDMEPYFHERPWTEALRGKKVLIIHPFEESIKYQYSRRSLLFSDATVLPEYELKTLKAVQTVANNRMGYRTWFHALEAMKEKISKIDFDVAILGCGAYGFPLAAHIKRLGKTAIHIGGAAQLLFGIKGARWEDRAFYKDLINPHWIKPLPQDHPAGYKTVENGCYW